MEACSVSNQSHTIFSGYVQPMVQAFHILWSMKNRCHYERCLKTPYGTFGSKGSQLTKNSLHEKFSGICLLFHVVAPFLNLYGSLSISLDLPCKIDVVNSMDKCPKSSSLSNG